MARRGQVCVKRGRRGRCWGAGSGGAQHGAAMRTARLSLVGLSLVGLLLQGRGAPLLLSGRAEVDLLALLVPLVSHGELAAAWRECAASTSSFG